MRGAQDPGGPRGRSRGVYATRRLLMALVVLLVVGLVATRACQAFVGPEQGIESEEGVGSGAPKKAAQVAAGGATKDTDAEKANTEDASPDGGATDAKSEAGSEEAPAGKTSEGKDGEGQDDGAPANLADVLTESLAGMVAGTGMTNNEEGVAAGGRSLPSADRTPQISVVLVANKEQPNAGSPAAEDRDKSAGQDGTGPSTTAAPAPAPVATSAPVSTASAPAGFATTPPAPDASLTAAPVAAAPAASQRGEQAQGRGNRVGIARVAAQPKFGGVGVRKPITTAPVTVQPVAPAPVQPVAPAPAQPVAPAPVQPVAPAPVQPVAPAPVPPTRAAVTNRTAAFAAGSNPIPAGIGDVPADLGGGAIGAPVNNGGAFPGAGAVRRGASPVANNVGVGGRVATAALPGG
jgi:hypothetical protein